MNTTPLALARARDEAKPGDRDIARLLAKRYGDGTVYLPSGGAMGLYRTCMALGFVSTAMEAIDRALSSTRLPPGVAQAAQPSNTAAAEADKSPATSRTAKPRD